MSRFQRSRVRSGGTQSASTRSAVEWGIRGFLAVGALSVGYLSVTGALANVLVSLDPNSALQLSSLDGRVVAALAQHEFSLAPDVRAVSTQAQLARNALRSDPTAVEALNVLGSQAQMRSDDQLADGVFRYSIALSRRELQPQIWSIEKAVSRGDIDQALKYYDISLRTSVKARGILFPILSATLGNEKISYPLSRLVLNNPSWAKSFVKYAATRSRAPKATAAFFREISAGGFPVEDDDKARLVNVLLANDLTEEAWNYYISFRPHVGRETSRDKNFSLDKSVSTKFDWNLGNDPGLSVAILRNGKKGILDFSVPPSTGATVVSQMQLMPAGVYKLEGRASKIDQPARSRPYWSLRCYPGQEIGRVEIPKSGEQGSAFSGTFTVPPNCPVQMLSLRLRASDSIFGVAGQIENVRLASPRKE